MVLSTSTSYLEICSLYPAHEDVNQLLYPASQGTIILRQKFMPSKYLAKPMCNNFIEFTPHYCRGRLPVAFVFSAPGAEEAHAIRPIAGETGVNLDTALLTLHAAMPHVFSSENRYEYRITNAIKEPLAVSRGDRVSEASNSKVCSSVNIARVLEDIDGSSIVILCGRKAQLLSSSITTSGRVVLHACHAGNKALNTKYKLESYWDATTAAARRERRTELWAHSVLAELSRKSKA